MAAEMTVHFKRKLASSALLPVTRPVPSYPRFRMTRVVAPLDGNGSQITRPSGVHQAF